MGGRGRASVGRASVVGTTEEYLHMHACNGDLSRVKKAIEKRKADIFATDDDGATVLHHASGSDSVDIVKYLIGAGSPIDARDNNGFTPLHCAAISGDVGSARLLLSSGADPLAKDKRGVTPLKMARPGDMGMIQLLSKATQEKRGRQGRSGAGASEARSAPTQRTVPPPGRPSDAGALQKQQARATPSGGPHDAFAGAPGTRGNDPVPSPARGQGQDGAQKTGHTGRTGRTAIVDAEVEPAPQRVHDEGTQTSSRIVAVRKRRDTEERLRTLSPASQPSAATRPDVFSPSPQPHGQAPSAAAPSAAAPSAAAPSASRAVFRPQPDESESETAMQRRLRELELRERELELRRSELQLQAEIEQRRGTSRGGSASPGVAPTPSRASEVEISVSNDLPSLSQSSQPVRYFGPLSHTPSRVRARSQGPRATPQQKQQQQQQQQQHGIDKDQGRAASASPWPLAAPTSSTPGHGGPAGVLTRDELLHHLLTPPRNNGTAPGKNTVLTSSSSSSSVSLSSSTAPSSKGAAGSTSWEEIQARQFREQQTQHHSFTPSAHAPFPAKLATHGTAPGARPGLATAVPNKPISVSILSSPMHSDRVPRKNTPSVPIAGSPTKKSNRGH